MFQKLLANKHYSVRDLKTRPKTGRAEVCVWSPTKRKKKTEGKTLTAHAYGCAVNKCQPAPMSSFQLLLASQRKDTLGRYLSSVVNNVHNQFWKKVSTSVITKRPRWDEQLHLSLKYHFFLRSLKDVNFPWLREISWYFPCLEVIHLGLNFPDLW